MSDNRTAKLAELKARREKSAVENKVDARTANTASKPTLSNERPSTEQQRRRPAQDEETSKVDNEKLKLLSYSIDDQERWTEKLTEKSEREQVGFSDYAQLAAKKYNRLSREIKPNFDLYLQQKTSGANVYRDANSLEYASVAESQPSAQSLDKMTKDLDAQYVMVPLNIFRLLRRSNMSKRRVHDEDDDVTYINERNKHFNKKIARAYDKYTKEIKASFERGTALE